jgi:threonine/homoserine/homoserine lactone efflux protein
MAAVTVFFVIAFAGCAFLLYFLYALWREEHTSRKQPRVEIRKLQTLKRDKAKLLQFYPIEELRERKRL